MGEAKTFMVEDATIIFKNFEGKEDKYNRAGDRNFSVILTTDVAKAMESDGWNIKYLRAREEGEEQTPYISVAVNFKNRPPRIMLITSTTRTLVTEDIVDTLDYADISMIDLIARGYEWDVNGKRGVKAYLQSMFVTIEEDALELKYSAMTDEEN